MQLEAEVALRGYVFSLQQCLLLYYFDVRIWKVYVKWVKFIKFSTSPTSPKRPQHLFVKTHGSTHFSKLENYQLALKDVHELTSMAQELRNIFEEHVFVAIDKDTSRRCVETAEGANRRLYTNDFNDPDFNEFTPEVIAFLLADTCYAIYDVIALPNDVLGHDINFGDFYNISPNDNFYDDFLHFRDTPVRTSDYINHTRRPEFKSKVPKEPDKLVERSEKQPVISTEVII